MATSDQVFTTSFHADGTGTIKLSYVNGSHSMDQLQTMPIYNSTDAS
jgi:hypothetical protein